MIERVGDLLNWAAAGVVTPLMFLPLAAFAVRLRALSGALVFLMIVLLAAGAGIGFVVLAPRLDIADLQGKAVIFGGCLATLVALIALMGGPTRATRRLASLFEAIARGAGRLVMGFVFVMALVQFCVVILRYVFGINSIFMQESITYMHGAVFLLAAGYALSTDDHVRVDIFYRGASARRKALVDLVGTYVFLFPVALAILWTASAYVGHSWEVGEGSTEQSGIKGVFLLKSLIPAFAILLAMAGFAKAARAGEILRGSA
jgi:TRAP-type mannitol/chloroaromatic compound transport system permease small subunit